MADLIFNPQYPDLKQNPSDIVPPIDRGDLTLDEDHLRSWLFETFDNDIRDKEDYGWAEKRIYDIDSYYGLKNEALTEFPWKGASAFRVPMTPTFVDTIVANVNEDILGSDLENLKVSGVGQEDKRTSLILSSYMLWKMRSETNVKVEGKKTFFRQFFNGTSFLKCIRDSNNNIVSSSIDSENMFVPIDASGMQKDGTDRIHQVIPLSYNDLQLRKRFYRDIDKIIPGVGRTSIEQLKERKDIVTGTSLVTKYHRETYFVVETYMTYIAPNSRPKEIVVLWSPNGLNIHRVRENKDGFRPYSDFHAYENPGRFWSMSMSEKCRSVQEELDYANKQYTDALDKNNAPAMFIESTDEFDQTIDQRKPAGIYKIGRNNRISAEPMNPVERGFYQKTIDLWNMGERLTGIFDITQGAVTERNQTLGETRIRTARADIRYAMLLDNSKKGMEGFSNLVYEYANRYESREKKLKVLGYTDLKTIDEIFPQTKTGKGLGLEGNFNFLFTIIPSSERERQKQLIIQFWKDNQLNPLFAPTDPIGKASLWKLTKEYYEAIGKKDFESLCSKPKEANIYSVEEFIERIMSGQYTIEIRPGIDAQNYLFELQLFMKTETFSMLEQPAQMAVLSAINKATAIRDAEAVAMAKFNALKIAQNQIPMGQGRE